MDWVGLGFGKARELQFINTCVLMYSDTLVAYARLDVLSRSLDFKTPM